MSNKLPELLKDEKLLEIARNYRRNNFQVTGHKAKWVYGLIVPVFQHIRTIITNVQWDEKDYGPFGLGSRCSLYGTYKEQTIGITICPDDLYRGTVCFETGERTKAYKEKTIGWYNGFNNVTAELTHFQQLVDVIKQQQAEIDSKAID